MKNYNMDLMMINYLLMKERIKKDIVSHILYLLINYTHQVKIYLQKTMILIKHINNLYKIQKQIKNLFLVNSLLNLDNKLFKV